MMSLDSPELRIKDEPCDFQLSQTSILIKYEHETAQADYMVQEVKEEWETVEHDVSDVSRVDAESALTDHKDLKVDSGLIDHVNLHSGLIDQVVHSGTEDVGLFLKQEVKEEIVVGPVVFQRPKVSVLQELLMRDKNPETPDALRNGIHLDHQKKHVEHPLYKCSHCSFTSLYPSNLRQHEKRGHNKGSRQHNKRTEPDYQNTPIEENWYKCGYCANMTRYKFNYTRQDSQHIVANRLKNLENIHRQLTEQATEISVNNQENNQNCQPILKHENPDEVFKCTLDHSSSSLECLESKEKPFKCKYCSYSCDQKSALEYHERKHIGERLFQCTRCDYSFAFESDLIQHEAMHGTELLECTVCSYTCTNKYILIRHKRTHKEKPFKCVYCDFDSKFESIMIVHEREHTGIQPLQCVHCKYIARNMERLQKHLEIIHNSCKSYTCKHCSYSSVRKNHFDVHLRRCGARNVFKHILLEHDYCENQGSELK